MTPNPGRVPVRVIFGVATALGFFSAFAAFYFISTFTDKPAGFGLLLALNLTYWYSWAVLTPGILCLTRNFPFERATWQMAIPVHIAGVFVATLLHVAMAVASRMATYWVVGESLDSWLREAQQMFFLNFDWEMMTYWTRSSKMPSSMELVPGPHLANSWSGPVASAPCSNWTCKTTVWGSRRRG